jgi:hypothetical protein
MPALGPDGPGLFVTSEDDPHASTFYTLDPADDGRPLPARAPGALAACASSAPDPRAVSVLGTAPGYGPAVLFGGRFLHSARDEAQPWIEFTPQGESCLRGFTLWPQNPNDPQERQLLDELGGLPRLRAASGGITGTVMDPHVEGAVVCQWRR